MFTVGPIYGQDPVNEEKQLYSCYKNSLELAKRKQLKSIAFPVISSGIYGYPKKEAIKIATGAIRDFLDENEMNVYLVIYDTKAFEISEKLFSDVKSYIDERFVEEDFYDYAPAADFSTPFSPAVKKSETIVPKKSLEDLMNMEFKTFSEMLLRLIDEKGMSDVEVYKRANIDRKLFSKIRKKITHQRKLLLLRL
ncbi:MAG: macro domain-containing protein [Clostridiales bacterium]|nr:macro domain-containing protein [Clostridiales bacterium]